jgi:hypothetical protein
MRVSSSTVSDLNKRICPSVARPDTGRSNYEGWAATGRPFPPLRARRLQQEHDQRNNLKNQGESLEQAWAALSPGIWPAEPAIRPVSIGLR